MTRPPAVEKRVDAPLAGPGGSDELALMTGFTEPGPKKAKDKTPSPGVARMLKFNLKPEAMESYLDAFVIRQDEAKAVLATKVCTHFNRIRYLSEKGLKDAPSVVGTIKNNILLVGPTGVGKTYLVKLLAQKLGAPFAKGDATKFSETGYVGGDVEDLVRDLVYAAQDDVELAQMGIIYVDEIDKIASSHSLIGPDVSRTGVQRALLKPMEETEVELRVPHDPISQIQAIEAYRKTGKREKRTVNTRHILFIMSGAFNGLEEIIRKRLHKQTIGFAAQDKSSRADCLRQVTPEDLIEYGFESEFVGRLPMVVVLDELTADDLAQILLNPNNPVVLSKKRDFAAYGVDLQFEEEALRLVALEAAQQKTGARSLVSVLDKALLPFEKRLPSTTIPRLLVTSALVRDPAGELRLLLACPSSVEEPEYLERFAQARRAETVRLRDSLVRRAEEIRETYELCLDDELMDLVAEGFDAAGLDVDRSLTRIKEEVGLVRQFEAKLLREFGLKAVFDQEAVYTAIRVARRAGLSPADYLNQRLSEIAFGLQLVRDRTGLDEFIISREALLHTAEFVQQAVSQGLQAKA